MLRVAEYNIVTGEKIELKELKQFGFVESNFYNHLYSKVICEGRRGQQFELIVDEDRIINGYSEGADGDGEMAYLDNTLFDMMKYGFIEKVND